MNEFEELERIEARLRTILPEDYEDSYESIEPKPMRAAPLAFDPEGKVAWDAIWGSFCDLALAGGPPHKGSLLRPAAAADIYREPMRYREVTAEICRGVTMTTSLPARPSRLPGWVRVDCTDEPMAAWLLRAIVVENVAVRQDRAAIGLPAAPHFRLEKEIKNVVTVIAKTVHYWSAHMSGLKRRAVGRALAEIAREAPLVIPPEDGATTGQSWSAAAGRAADLIESHTPLRAVDRDPSGWLGLECPSIRAAVWMMRVLVVSNVLARRQGTTLYVPVNPSIDPSGTIVDRVVSRTYRFAQRRQAA
jgi:hypothetical protein